MIDYRTIPYSMGGNDTVGDCVIVDVANVVNVWDARRGVTARIETTECLRMYTEATGYTAENPGSDKGAVLADVLAYWRDHGWSTEPTLAPKSFRLLRLDEIIASIARYGAVMTWAMLPQDAEGNWDFSDTATGEGVGAHAMAAVQADANGLVLVSWAMLKPVTWDWWRRYGQQVFEVVPPDWVVAEWE